MSGVYDPGLFSHALFIMVIYFLMVIMGPF
jgi:hypothetical protein